MLTPLAVSISGASEVTSLSPSIIDNAIRAGSLPVRRCGNRTLIRMSDLVKWVDSFPEGRPAAPAHLDGKRTGRPRKCEGLTGSPK